jgi:integral membrane protein (TIGR01906 family)
MFNNKSFYYSEYDKNNVYDNVAELNNMNISESKNYVKDVTENIFSFFKGKAELKYFTDEEKSHMNNVKFVISSINFIYYSSAIFFIIIFIILYLLHKNNKISFIEHLSKILLYGSSASLIFLVILFLWSVFSFESLFFLMHLVLFPQGNWMFDPSSMLITLFPERFFFDIALRIFVYAIFQSGVFFIIGYWLRKQIKMTAHLRKHQ